MIGLIGVSDTLALMKARGGLPLYIAMDAAKAGVLLEILPLAKVQILCESVLRGTTIELPKADAMLRCIRNIDIKTDIENGVNNWTLAKKHNLTRRQIINIKQQVEVEELNLSLF